MNHLKYFENINNTYDYEVGDYVYVKFIDPVAPNTKRDVESYNYIGIIKSFDLTTEYSKDDKTPYITIIFKVDVIELAFSHEEIEFHSKSKEEILAYAESKKYNL